MLLPVAEGGDGASRCDFFETVEAVARADGSAGWCLSVCAAMADFAFKGLPPAGRREVFGAGPTAIFASLLPRAVSAPAPGGFRVSGSFAMGSGSSLADWVVVSAPLDDRDGRQWFRAHILPKEEVAIRPDSWEVMGLRATTSIEYAIAERFAPAHRTFEYPYAQARQAGSVSALYGVLLNLAGLTGFASGLGQRALAELLAAAPQIKRTIGEGTQADDHLIQFGVGELEGRMRAGRTHFLGLAAEQDQHVAEHGYPDPAAVLDLQQAAQTLARAARDTIVFAFDYAGTGVIFASDPVQRCLRDIFTGLKHVAFTPNLLTRAGKTRLGQRAAPVRLS
jgi:alkylation response protein AidB-like acyl-CoA dehydrogenase